ncbi:MAG TPA: hypothetical protein VFY29_03165, partial [Terriglobia bacterium]|nr:hypothetical protein [Terriglobia bacterium]
MLRFFHKAPQGSLARWARRAALAAVVLGVAIAATGVGIYFYLGSDRFRDQARAYIEHNLSLQTGAEVSLGQFDWDLRAQHFHLENVTLRGSEPPEGPPLAFIQSIDAGINLRGLIEGRADLFELTIERPRILLLVDSEGRTNIPV